MNQLKAVLAKTGFGEGVLLTECDVYYGGMVRVWTLQREVARDLIGTLTVYGYIVRGPQPQWDDRMQMWTTTCWV